MGPVMTAVVAASAHRSPAGRPAVYDVLVALHVVSAVLGFGALAVGGVYGAIARSGGETGVKDARRFLSSPNRAEYVILVAPVFGLVAMAFRPGGSEYGDAWAIIGVGVWIAASLLLLVVARPAEAAIRRDPDGDLARPAGRLLAASVASDLLFVVALFVMVTQPG